MTRQIKGYKFLERIRDAWEEMKAIKLYTGIYGKDQLKILSMKNQFGQSYTDIYLKKGAKPIREIVAKFGSTMTFEDKEGKKYGDVIRIRRK